MTSVAIVTRAYDAEAPYIESFIEHYQRRNCHEIHVVIPYGNKSSVLEPLLEKYSCVQVHRCTSNDVANDEAQNEALPHVRASHILSIDVDEFLQISDLEQLAEIAYAKLYWTIAPYLYSALQSRVSPVLGFRDLQCKYCVRKDLCSYLGIHDARLRAANIQFHPVDAPLIHYTFRSFGDLVLKCSMGSYGCYFDGDSAVLWQTPSDVRKLPVKFKMAAFYQLVAESSGTCLEKYYDINFEIENKLLVSTGLWDKLQDIEHAFFEYKARINLEKLIRNIKKTKEAKAYKRLPHHKIAEIADKTLMLGRYDVDCFTSVRGLGGFF